MPKRPESTSQTKRIYRHEALLAAPGGRSGPTDDPEVASFWRRRGLFIVLFSIGAVALLYAASVFVSAIRAPTSSPVGNPQPGSTAGAAGLPGETASPSPDVTPSASAQPSPTVAAAKPPARVVGSCAGAGTNVLDGRDPSGGCWPGPSNTGVPSGVTLKAYTGSCNITKANTVLTGQIFTCDVRVSAMNVVIEKSQINGTIEGTDSGSSFTLSDSTVNASYRGIEQVTGVGDSNYSLLRSEVMGGNRGVYCQMNCTIKDSWVHGQKIKDDWHASAVRMEQKSTITHNSLVCDAPVQPNPEGSCSATLTGYGDFAPIRDNVISQNLFMATTYAAFCAYGGATKGKPYSGQTANITFKDNVFQKGKPGEECALYGPISDWDPGLPGMVWANNKFDDGEVIANTKSST